MAAATGADMVGDLDCDIFDFDVIDALDLDLPSADDEFRGGGACGYPAVFSDANIVSHCRHGHGCDDGDSGAAAMCGWLVAGLGADDREKEGGGSSSLADSGVTDDKPMITPVAGDAIASEAMSAYVAEMERFLLDDDDEQAEVDQGLLGVVDDYFAGDQQFYHADSHLT